MKKDYDPDEQPVLPRESGEPWPSGLTWTDAERLELRDLQLAQALQERDRLRAALQKYGRHHPFCGHGHCSANPCTCGLAAALGQDGLVPNNIRE